MLRSLRRVDRSAASPCCEELQRVSHVTQSESAPVSSTEGIHLRIAGARRASALTGRDPAEDPGMTRAPALPSMTAVAQRTGELARRSPSPRMNSRSSRSRVEACEMQAEPIVRMAPQDFGGELGRETTDLGGNPDRNGGLRNDPPGPPRSPSLSELIRAHREQILTAWEQAVRGLPVARNLDRPTLVDHIPSVLDR